MFQFVCHKLKVLAGVVEKQAEALTKTGNKFPVFVFCESVFRAIAATRFDERAVLALPGQRVLFPLFKKQLSVAFCHFGYIFFKEVAQFIIFKDKMVAGVYIAVVFNG